MSKADGQRHLRKLRCEGCYRRCRYALFKVRPGERGGALYQGVVDELTVAEDTPEKWRYKRKGTVLGYLHDEKMTRWKEHTSGCPHWGEKLKLGDVVAWTTDRGTQHTGVLYMEVPAGSNGRTFALKWGLFGFDYNLLNQHGAVRSLPSYLVECEKHRGRRPLLAWPHVERLSRVVDPPF